MFNPFKNKSIASLSALSALVSALTLLSTTASASCGTLYCTSGAAPKLAPTAYTGAPYAGGSEYSMAPIRSGAVMSSYSGYNTPQGNNHPQMIPFSGKLQGLGANESLTPTTCPVNVYNPNGNEVLGCYNVVKTTPPVQVQNYIRVVRPIIYVRYPVPVQMVQFQTASCGNGGGAYSPYRRNGFDDRGASRYGNYNVNQYYGQRTYGSTCH